jgi:hypothetical protein
MIGGDFRSDKAGELRPAVSVWGAHHCDLDMLITKSVTRPAHSPSIVARPSARTVEPRLPFSVLKALQREALSLNNETPELSTVEQVVCSRSGIHDR